MEPTEPFPLTSPQYFDGNKRIWYTFNAATRQFVVSDSGAAAMASLNMPGQPAAQSAASLSQWQELVDPTTNQKYYYNSVTQASSWTPPPGFGGYALPQQAIPQQAITSTSVVQKPQTFGLQVRTRACVITEKKRIRVRAAQGPRGMARGLVQQQVSSSARYAFDGGAAQEEEEQSEEMKQVLRRQAQRVSGLQSRTSLSDSQREARDGQQSWRTIGRRDASSPFRFFFPSVACGPAAFQRKNALRVVWFVETRPPMHLISARRIPLIRQANGAPPPRLCRRSAEASERHLLCSKRR